MATTLRYILLGDDRASSAVDRYARSVDKANAATARQQAALKRQREEEIRAGKSLSGLTAHVTGFQDALNVASPKTSTFAKVLAAANVAMGIGEPAAAALTVTTLGLAAAWSSAAAGAGAYMIALKPLLTQTGAVMKAQQKLDAARTSAQITYTAAVKAGASPAAAALARTRAMATAQQQYTAAVKDSPPAVRAFSKEVLAVQKQYKSWADGLARPVLAPLRKALTIVGPALHALSPLVRAAAGAIGTLIDQLARSVKGGGLERLVTVILPHVRPAILDLGHSIGNIAVGIGGILRAFLPMADGISRGVERLTAKFRDWATSLPSHSGFQSLVAMYKQDAPLLRSLLQNVVVVMKNLVAATTGLASPANSKALLQILVPLSKIMVQLSANQGLVRAVLYFGLLRGALTRLGGAFRTVAGGAASLGELFKAGQKAYGVIGRFQGGLTNAAVAASAFSGKAGTMGGRLAEIAAKGGPAVEAIAGMALPVAAGALAVAGLTAALIHFAGSITDTTDKMAAQDKAIGFNIAGYRKLADQTVATQYSQTALGQAVRDQVPAYRSVREGAAAYGQTLGQLNQVHVTAESTAVNLTSRMSTLQQAYGLTSSQVQKLAGHLGITAQALGETGVQGDAAFRKMVAYAGGAGQAWVASLKLTDAQNALNGALQRVQNTVLAQQQAQIAYKQAMQQATIAINASTTGLKGNSAAALNAKDSVVQMTTQAINLANAELQQKNGVQKATDTIKDQIRWLQDHGQHSKFATDQINALRDALAQIKNKDVHLKVHGDGTFMVPIGGGRYITSRSTGGGVRGPGGPTSDTAGLYALSNREWVIRAQSATAYGDKAMDAVNRGRAAIMYRGMAGGGQVISGSYADGAAGLGRFDKREYDLTVGAAERATARATVAAIRAEQAKQARQGGFGGISGGAGGGPNVAIGKRMAASIGWMEESGWRTNAQNPSGGGNPWTAAYGIPQSNPGSKMAAAGADWLTNPVTQIRWGLGYIRSTYGSPTRVPLWSAAGPLPGYLGYAKGGKVAPDPQQQKWLAMLARDVTLLSADRKHAAKRRTVLRHGMEMEELWFLTHPGVPKGTISYHEHEQALRASRLNLRRFNREEAAKERLLTRKIALLRDLTGYPRGRKYGGPGVPAPPGTGGDTGAGGGAGAPTGPPPIPPPPMPAWMVAAGLGGGAQPGGGAMAAPPAFMAGGMFAAPGTDPLAGRISAGRAAGMGGGAMAGLAELAVALRFMTREMTGAVRQVAPGVALGFDQSLNSMSARVAGKVPP